VKVLHVQKSAGIGGSERHLLALLPALARRGVEVRMVVLTAPGSGAFTAALAAAGVPITEIPAGPDVNPVLVARLAACIRRERPDLVHTHLIHADVHGQPAARLARVAAVSSAHGAHPFYRRQPFRSAAAVAGHLARRTIAISHHVAATLAGAGVVPSERLRVVHYGIDPAPWQQALAARDEARRRFGLDGCELAVGVASRLIPHKGHAELLRAVAIAAGRGVPLRLAVAGDGPIRAELQRLAADLGVAERVRFLGFIGDVAAFMAACDVVAFPTQPILGEGFGLAALEAMAAGRPVVATRVASLPEVVVDGETGLLVPPGDPEGLADAFACLAADEALRARLGAAAARRAADCFSLDAMVEATLAVYAETLERA
jgi:glycosyltransferase involved in cell wall biosynthesis